MPVVVRRPEEQPRRDDAMVIDAQAGPRGPPPPPAPPSAVAIRSGQEEVRQQGSPVPAGPPNPPQPPPFGGPNPYLELASERARQEQMMMQQNEALRRIAETVSNVERMVRIPDRTDAWGRMA